MLFLHFQLGEERYAMEATLVTEVLPVVRWRALPQVPPAILGVMEYRGGIVPLLDLSLLTTGQAAPLLLSTRIMVIEYRDKHGSPLPAPHMPGGVALLGLLAEKVTRTFIAAPEEFTPPGVDMPQTRYLGPVRRDENGLVQRVEPFLLLTEEICSRLFAAPLGPEVGLGRQDEAVESAAEQPPGAAAPSPETSPGDAGQEMGAGQGHAEQALTGQEAHQ